MSIIQRIVQMVNDILHIVLGALFAMLTLTFLLFSTPVYLLRIILSVVAKWVRPDLGDILNAHSCIFVNDYFSKRPPRSNIVVTIICQGQHDYNDIKKLIGERWIQARDKEGNLKYERFSQHPVRWMGFTFWRWDSCHFPLDSHVHKLSDKETQVTEDQLKHSVEKMLNCGYPKELSPWEFFVVENCQNLNSTASKDQVHSALIFKVHHCLADGFSIRSAIVNGLCDSPLQDVLPPQARYKNQTFGHRLKILVTFPIAGFLELSYNLSQYFQDCLWRVPDCKKQWCQIYDKTDPISISAIKTIKNHFGVSFTSVILSGISSAVCQSTLDISINNHDVVRLCDNIKPVRILSPLPITNRNEKDTLTNAMTAAFFGLPVTKFKSPSGRLQAVHKVLEQTQFSTGPLLMNYFGKLVGSHFYFVNKLFTSSKFVAMILTNFPGVPKNLELNGKPCVDVGFISGGLEGEGGLVTAVLSHDQQIRVEVNAEKGLLSKQQLSQFVQYISDEIQLLWKMSTEID